MAGDDDPSADGNGAEGANRRRAERVPVNAAFAELGDITHVSDLSERGVFIHTTDIRAIGDEIELRFTVVLDDPVVLRGVGRVVRHQKEPMGMGIEFLQLSPETMLRLADIVARSRPHELGPPLPSGGEPDELDSAKTVVRPRPAGLLRARVEVETTDDDLESSKTLVALRPVGIEPIEDDEPNEVVERGSRKKEDR